VKQKADVMSPDAALLKHCWFLAGPTAGGKTAAALCLAQRLNAEILSMDSMAIYRGMDIGTAKPNEEERAMVVHHLIDLVTPDQEYSVAEYVQTAWATVADIVARDRTPVFVGGTGLYLKAMLRGVFEGPEADWPFRRRLERSVEQHGHQWLHNELRKIDPVAADRLHPNDVRRIVRAIEVHHVTGQSLTDQHAQQAPPTTTQPAAVLWLDPPRAWLHERINRRVDMMMQQGLLQETERLLATDPPPGRTARQALGYRELISHLEDGRPLDKCVTQIKTGTRQFAKRQHTWFRNLKECTSVVITGDESPEMVAHRLQQTVTAPRVG